MIAYENIMEICDSVVQRKGCFDDLQNVKDLAQTCLTVLIENDYEVVHINCDGSFEATKTEVL